MNTLNHNKLNYLLKQWLPGTVMTSAYLAKQGYSPHLLRSYQQNGWVEKIGGGAFTRLNEVVKWVGAVHTLQNQVGLSVHVGGITALEHYGLGHNIRFEQSGAYLYNTTSHKKLLPQWFLTAFPDCYYFQYHLFKAETGLKEKVVDGIPVVMSIPERAALELLALVPHAYDYEDASNVIENCRLQRGEVFQELLENCLSIKVKRLFLYLAQKHQLDCFEQLNIKRIELGKGKRKIGVGGKYIPEYQLSVPYLPYHDQEGAGHV